MYSRRIEDRVLKLGHEGMLYRNSFIMYDHQTNSHWVHTTGECVKGKLKGKQLRFIPSSVMTWGAWRKLNPMSLVLEGEMTRGFMGTFRLNAKSPNRYGISIGQGATAKLFSIKSLLVNPVVQDRLGDDDVVIFFDKESLHATAWIRGKNEFRQVDGKILDQRGREWNAMLGQPIGADNASEKMRPIAATVWLIERWRGFYPKASSPSPKDK